MNFNEYENFTSKHIRRKLQKFGFPSLQIDFDAFLKIIKKELVKEALCNCQQIASKTGLSDMTLEEINAEILQQKLEKGQMLVESANLYVEVLEEEENSQNVEGILNLTGIWKDIEVDANKLREEAWQKTDNQKFNF